MKFHHFAMEVSDLDQSVSFYQKYLGLLEESRMTFNEEKIVFLTSEDFRLELIANEQPPPEIQNTIHLCFEVPNLDEIIKTLQKNGLKAAEGPYMLANGWKTVFYEGPDNEILEFLQVKAG